MLCQLRYHLRNSFSQQVIELNTAKSSPGALTATACLLRQGMRGHSLPCTNPKCPYRSFALSATQKTFRRRPTSSKTQAKFTKFRRQLNNDASSCKAYAVCSMHWFFYLLRPSHQRICMSMRVHFEKLDKKRRKSSHFRADQPADSSLHEEGWMPLD